jgi:hypothetical protein
VICKVINEKCLSKIICVLFYEYFFSKMNMLREILTHIDCMYCAVCNIETK